MAPDRPPVRVPLSTYRIQFQPAFGFRDGALLVPYLAALGISHVYASPIFAARPGSTHGYDIVDHNRLNPELGGDEGFAVLVDALDAHGMRLILDIVPNHMSVDAATNPWWRDVLEHGPGSPFARYFDIDWQPVKAELSQKLLLPVLGEQYGRLLESGRLRARLENGAIEVAVADGFTVPTDPRTAPMLLRPAVDALRGTGDEPETDVLELLSILTQLEHLPPATARDTDQVETRRRESAVARERMRQLLERAPRVAEAVEQALSQANGRPDDPPSFDGLHAFLEAQSYRLAYWRTSAHEINYRRFFNVDALAGLRIEEEDVFRATHALIGQLLRTAPVDGLRVDHPDGLRDPAEYFARLRALAGERASELYVIAEKILVPGESLRADWPIQGTTGYPFITLLTGLMVAPSAMATLRRIYGRFSGRTESVEENVYRAKRLIMETELASELNVLAHELNRLSEADRRSRDFTLNSLRSVLREYIACLPVYRRYVTEAGCTESDVAVTDAALDQARRRNPSFEPSVFDFLRDVLIECGREERPDRAARLRFVMKLQQYTGPVQAKGVEDTAFFRDSALIAVNEVGGDPARPVVSPAEFHAANQVRQEHWPHDMLATATHDTKLGEDTRARLAALSEDVDGWRVAVGRWSRLNASHRTPIGGSRAPDRNDEYRFYQALVGIWPLLGADGSDTRASLVERLKRYMAKASREAKLHTSWINENKRYDAALARFVEQALTARTSSRFIASVDEYARPLMRAGAVNSLAQVVLKMTAPGVPDFYQGTEGWSFTLVDPDNRSPIDYGELRGRVAEMAAVSEPERDWLEEWLRSWTDGRLKTWTVVAGLRARREASEAFREGAYEALAAEGTSPGNVVAFARTAGQQAAIVVTPRHVMPLVREGEGLPVGDAWRDRRVVLPPSLAGRRWRHAFTGQHLSPGETLECAQLFEAVPVAILIAD